MVKKTYSEILPAAIDATAVEERLKALAERHRRAGNVGIQVLNMVGGQAEGLLSRLPVPVRSRLDDSTERALRMAMETAHRSRGYFPDSPGWLSRAMTTAMGAAGGAGGLPTALAELPVTTTVLLRAIQDVAAEYGFDPDEPGVQYDCIKVFAAAGPLDHDDGSDLAFLSTRVAVTGKAVQALVAKVAPRLATVLGQKLAAQTVPVLGAAAGAATNYAFTSYYQQMAHVHFGLRRLAIEADRDHAELLEDFRDLVELPSVKRA
ncbi:MAG: EcsC family protein [Roseovarius confluentis]